MCAPAACPRAQADAHRRGDHWSERLQVPAAERAELHQLLHEAHCEDERAALQRRERLLERALVRSAPRCGNTPPHVNAYMTYMMWSRVTEKREGQGGKGACYRVMVGCKATRSVNLFACVGTGIVKRLAGAIERIADTPPASPGMRGR